MAGNSLPLFIRAGDIQVGGAVLGPTANTALDGTGAAVTVIFQADATNGGRINAIRLKAVGSPAATVARLFFCSATGAFTPGTTNTAANTALISEVPLVAITLSQTAATTDYEFTIPPNLVLAAGTRLLIAFGTSTGASGTGYAVTVLGGAY